MLPIVYICLSILMLAVNPGNSTMVTHVYRQEKLVISLNLFIDEGELDL